MLILRITRRLRCDCCRAAVPFFKSFAWAESRPLRIQLLAIALILGAFILYKTH